MLTYDVQEKVCLSSCHAMTDILLDVHKVHMEMVVAGLVVHIDSQHLLSYPISLPQRLCPDRPALLTLGMLLATAKQ